MYTVYYGVTRQFIKKNTTVIGISISFIMAFLFLNVSLSSFHEENYLSIEEQIFYSQNFDQNKKKIFIFGASPINAINSKIVDSVLHNTDINFKTYNLGKGSDDPDKRKDSLNLIIESNPKVVLYGIGYRDFQAKVPTTVNSETMKIRSILPDPHNFFEEQILSKVKFYELELDYLKNPKLSTLQIIKSFNVKKIESDNTPVNLDENHPLRTPEQVQTAYTKKSDEYLQDLSKNVKSTIERYGIEPNYKNRYSISLYDIIDKLQQNNIQVILFTYPHHKYFLQNVPYEEEEKFMKIINEIKKEFKIPVKLLHEEYRDKENWSDLIHIHYNYNLTENNEDSIQYSEDIANLILNEIG
jgi:hypothetical protein